MLFNVVTHLNPRTSWFGRLASGHTSPTSLQRKHLSNIWQCVLEFCDACGVLRSTNTAGFISPKALPWTKKKRQVKNGPAGRQRQKQAREVVIFPQHWFTFSWLTCMKGKKCKQAFFWNVNKRHHQNTHLNEHSAHQMHFWFVFCYYLCQACLCFLVLSSFLGVFFQANQDDSDFSRISPKG